VKGAKNQFGKHCKDLVGNSSYVLLVVKYRFLLWSWYDQWAYCFALNPELGMNRKRNMYWFLLFFMKRVNPFIEGFKKRSGPPAGVILEISDVILPVTCCPCSQIYLFLLPPPPPPPPEISPIYLHCPFNFKIFIRIKQYH
jgi:hypothetical protein